MTDMILIRHGETDWNRELRFQGQIDVPLNDIGHLQARRVAERLVAEPIHHIYQSDLTRTRQTALPSAQRLSLAGVDEPGLREQHFGIVEGMRVADIKACHPDDWLCWLRFEADWAFAGGGESTRRFHARVTNAVRRLAAQHPRETLLIFTHGGVLDMIWRTAMGLALEGPRQSQIPNGGINRVRVDGDRIDVLAWADARHLDGMPAQPVYDQTKAAGLSTTAAAAALMTGGFAAVAPGSA